MSWLSFLIGVGLGVLLDNLLPPDWSIVALITIAIAIVILRLSRKKPQG